MAYQARGQYEEEEAPQKSEGGIAAPNAPMTPITLTAAPAPVAPATAPAPGGVPGSKFVNFERILNANKDVAERSARNAAKRIDTTGQGVQSGLTGVSSAFNTAVTQATPEWVGPGEGRRPVIERTTPGHNGGLTGVSSQGQGLQGEAQQQGPALPPGQVDEKTARDRAAATYTGPRSLDEMEGWGDLRARFGGLKSELDVLGQRGGMSALARREAGGGANYTSGMNRMDAGLLGAVDGGRFEALRKKYAGLDKAFMDAGDAAHKTATGAADAIQNMAGEYQGALKKFDEETADIRRAEDERIAGEQADDEFLTSVEDEFTQIANMEGHPLREVAKMSFDATHGRGSYDRALRAFMRRKQAQLRKQG